MSKPVCIIMVGLPACGKSTLVNKLMGNHSDNAFVYSTDNLIEEWAAEDGKTYNEVFNDLIGKATSEMNRLLDAAIRNRQDIVWDQTNLGVNKRRKIINRMRNAGYEVECECIMPPKGKAQIAEWQRRLAGRPGKSIPGHIVTSMLETYVIPAVDEGFEPGGVYFYDMYGNRE